jgi:hypothetical protein
MYFRNFYIRSEIITCVVCFAKIVGIFMLPVAVLIISEILSAS